MQEIDWIARKIGIDSYQSMLFQQKLQELSHSIQKGIARIEELDGEPSVKDEQDLPVMADATLGDDSINEPLVD